jgi:hypothetical protein
MRRIRTRNCPTAFTTADEEEEEAQQKQEQTQSTRREREREREQSKRALQRSRADLESVNSSNGQL